METILFGNYYINGDIKEPIEWFVLERDGSKLLLVSKYVLDLYHYYERLKSITWENSDIRSWLNNEFLLNAFNSEELKKIQTTKIKNCDYLLNYTNGGNATCDKVFLLSNEEVLKYFPLKDSRICLGTLYAQNKFNTFV